MTGTARIPAVDGWFTVGDEPRLLGSRCGGCGSYFFPKELVRCRNPRCRSADVAEIPLSRRGRVWSATVNHYPPPPPFLAPEPFEPFGVAAVELEEEGMIVLGQVASEGPPGPLPAGTEVELVVEPLWIDADGEHLVWKWRPLP